MFLASHSPVYVSLRSKSTEYKSMIHSVPRDSLLSLSGRTCTCRWILLHSSVGFNHMICFCFLSSRRHGNLVYGCPQQQVKHRTPKQKGEFPSPSKQERFFLFLPPQFFSYTGKTACLKKKKEKERKCEGEITRVPMHACRQTSPCSRDSQTLTLHFCPHTLNTTGCIRVLLNA